MWPKDINNFLKLQQSVNNEHIQTTIHLDSHISLQQRYGTNTI